MHNKWNFKSNSHFLIVGTIDRPKKVADMFANIGVDQEDRMVSYIIPPDDLIPLLEADMRGVAFERV